jgi:hypothetical protein
LRHSPLDTTIQNGGLVHRPWSSVGIGTVLADGLKEMYRMIQPGRRPATITVLMVSSILLFTTVAMGQVTVGVSVFPDLPQILVLQLPVVKSLRTESGCEIRNGATGESEWRGLQRENGVAVQVVSVQFGKCTILFARILNDGFGPYHLVGDVALPMGDSPIVFYSRFGSDLQTQISNLISAIVGSGMPPSSDLASVSALSFN